MPSFTEIRPELFETDTRTKI